MIKNIVIVSDSGYVNGGNAKVAINSAIGLKDKGFKVYFFCGTKKIDDRLLQNGIEVISTEQNDILSDKNRIRAIINGVRNSKAKVEFQKVLKDLDPKDTIVHMHSWSKILSPAVWSVTKKMHFKVFVTMHDYFSCCPNGGLFIFPKNCICDKNPMSLSCMMCNCDSRKYVYKLWRVIRQIYQNCVVKGNNITFITISALNKELTVKYNSKLGNAVTVINPVELNNDLRVDISANQEYIYMGRVSEEKGIRYFCDAAVKTGIKAVIIGDGDILNDLKVSYPQVEFTGWLDREQIRQRLLNAKCLVFPSIWYEGAPLTIVEMLSCGIPCIVSDASSAKELIEQGKNGYIFKSGDTNDLIKCIKCFESDELNEMQDYIKQNFDTNEYQLETHVDNLIKCYIDGVRSET